MKITEQQLRRVVRGMLSEGLADEAYLLGNLLLSAGIESEIVRKRPRRFSQGVWGSSTGRSYVTPTQNLEFASSEERNAALDHLVREHGFQPLELGVEGSRTGQKVRFWRKGKLVLSAPSSNLIGVQTASVLRNPYFVRP